MSREDLLKVRSSLEKDPSEEVRRQVECAEPERKEQNCAAQNTSQPIKEKNVRKGHSAVEVEKMKASLTEEERTLVEVEDVRLEEAADPGN